VAQSSDGCKEGLQLPEFDKANLGAIQIAAYSTHPVVASLDHPLFCKQKRG